ncbi:MAG: RHS repeat-associated core domain-containing protein [Nonlabens sp.]
MGCERLTYRNFSFLEVVHRKNATAFKKNRCNGDHLGNVRLSYADADGSGDIDPNTEIISEKNYYPFGLTHKGYNNIISGNSSSVAEKFGFNGMEIQDELALDWYDFNARNYDPAIGRFMNLDPHAEYYYSYTPYSFPYNNPLKFTDPTGMDGVVSGSGTKDDPYVITANYYYYGLNEDEEKGFLSAINSYNNDGEARKVKTKEGKIYVSFNLTAEKKENQEAAEKAADGDTYNDEENSTLVRWGNTVSVGDVAGVDSLGDADNKHINLDRDAIANFNQSVSKTSKGVSIHEIGHNLGGVHNDPGSIMIQTSEVTQNSQIGGSSTSVTNPSVSKNGIRALIGRMRTPAQFRADWRNVPQRYLTNKEKSNIQGETTSGRILIFTPKPN